MTDGTFTTPLGGGTPPRNPAGGSAGSIPAPAPTVIPAGATAPVWQPWVNTQAKALSVLKTQIDIALRESEREQAGAQKILDGATALATAQTRQLEAAAWAAWHKYMNEAAAVHEAIMGPALTAYTRAMETAHSRLTGRLDPVEHAYARVAADAVWTQNLANGGATI